MSGETKSEGGAPSVGEELPDIEGDEVGQRELDAAFKTGDGDDVLVRGDESVHLHVPIQLLNRLDENLLVELTVLLARVHHLTLQLSRRCEDKRVTEAGDDGGEVRAVGVGICRVVIVPKRVDKETSHNRPTSQALEIVASRDGDEDRLPDEVVGEVRKVLRSRDAPELEEVHIVPSRRVAPAGLVDLEK